MWLKCGQMWPTEAAMPIRARLVRRLMERALIANESPGLPDDKYANLKGSKSGQFEN